MLIRAALKYLPAQLLAPLAQLASVVLWTHWLAPADMGLFTLVTVAQEMAYGLALGWFSVYALRYLPLSSETAARQRYLGAENAVVMASAAASAVAAGIVVWTFPAGEASGARVAVVALYFATRAFDQHYAERARAQQAYFAYFLLQAVGPVGGLALGLVALGYLSADPWVLLGAYSVAQAAALLLALPLIGMRLRLGRPDPALLRAAIGFGLPMLGLGLLAWVAENAIRYLVQWQAGAAALGLMVVGWSLGRRCAAVASMLVVTAAFPVAARLLNEGRRAQALAQLRVNAGLVFAVLVPVAAALVVLGPALVAPTVAASYRQVTAELLGLAVVGGAIRNLRIHTTDQLLVLDRRLRMAAAIDLIEIVACGVAAFCGLLVGGLPGAVAGQALGSLLTLGVGMRWAARSSGLAWPWVDSAKVVVATALMVAVLRGLGPWHGPAGAAWASVAGGAAYATALALLFMPRLRRVIADPRT